MRLTPTGKKVRVKIVTKTITRRSYSTMSRNTHTPLRFIVDNEMKAFNSSKERLASTEDLTKSLLDDLSCPMPNDAITRSAVFEPSSSQPNRFEQTNPKPSAPRAARFRSSSATGNYNGQPVILIQPTVLTSPLISQLPHMPKQRPERPKPAAKVKDQSYLERLEKGDKTYTNFLEETA